MSGEAVAVGGKDLTVWPEGQEITALDDDRTVLRTRFADIDDYHPGLVAKVLELAERPEFTGQRGRSMGGTKLYGLHEWDCPEAELLEARAAELFRRAMGSAQVAVDISWANVYRRGDYIMPHSHVRALASVVYMLAPGEPDPEDRNSGLFAFVDPRYGPCCRAEQGHMTNPVRLNLPAGAMIIFPGQLVHCVNPYGGATPRVTLSWNINREALPGSMLDSLKRQQAGQAD
ncbi:MAG: 2OG-Fe(II) oxygenase family protein [Rhodospirillales bacterium]|nr:2OG-Fe(II) oxygenase family protein [Rhodospirillales bacterium]